MTRNRLELLPDEGPIPDDWGTPLEAVEDLIPLLGPEDRQPWFWLFNAHDFMVMFRIVRPSRPTIVAYKHTWTRRYLFADASGQTYVHVPSHDLDDWQSGGTNRKAKSLHWSLWRLGLHEYIHMREEFQPLLDYLRQPTPHDGEELVGGSDAGGGSPTSYEECGEMWWAPPATPPPHIAVLLDHNCDECARRGRINPMSGMPYEYGRASV